MLTWPPKDPNEVLDFDIDWTMRLYSADELAQVEAGATIVPADAIASSQFTLPDGATLVASSSTYSATRTKVWLRDGDDGTSYEVLNRITTTGGRTMDQSVRLRVKSK